MKTAIKLRHCAILTTELSQRLERAYAFAYLDDPGRELFQKAERAILAAREAFAALAEYEDVR